jgi:hypothetical protein
LITRRWVYETLRKYGESSAFWQARVRGQFPDEAEGALASLTGLRRRVSRSRSKDDEAKLYAGIDVAEAGNNETVCALRTEAGCIVARRAWHGDARGPVIAFLTPFKPGLVEINFDCAGVGAYFGSDFEDLDFSNVNGVNVGEGTCFLPQSQGRTLLEPARALPRRRYLRSV